MMSGASTVRETDVAVIGLSVRFPGARDLDAFWRNLCEAVESISSFTEEEVVAAGVDPEIVAHPAYVRAYGAMAGVDEFDPGFFGVQPGDAALMDPQHRVLLECAWEALEDAGYPPRTYPGAIGLWVGATAPTYLNRLLARPELVERFGHYNLMVLNERDFLATRVSYLLNLRGPSLTVQTACSTSLVAIHSACQSVLSGECDMALAGGVSIEIPQESGYLYTRDGVGSADGHCRPFDAAAQGMVSGAGAGVVLLKPLAHALRDGDHVHAVIRGSAINNDGSHKVGFAAPSVDGQAAVIAEALEVAGVDPATVSYIEAHGTATPIGDPIEVEALRQVFGPGPAKTCGLGSVKSNLGHLDAAAGVAGFAKTVLALERGILPPTVHFERPNPELDLDRSPFYVCAAAQAWRPEAGPRRAGVSSFGMGGTNAHVVLEEAPRIEAVPGRRPLQLFLLSARSEPALKEMSSRLAHHIESGRDGHLADIAYTLQVGRARFEHRWAAVCGDAASAVERLRSRAPEETILGRAPAGVEPPICFMFPGHGSQHPAMARRLYETEPFFRDAFDRCSELVSSHAGFDPRELALSAGGHAELRRIRTALPILFAFEYALAKLWLGWGIRPAAMIGHSIGEYVAATLSGVFSLDGAVRVVAARARLIDGLPASAMLAVALDEPEVERWLGEDLWLAAVNGPQSCVISGTAAAIARLEAELTGREILHQRVRSSHAGHCRLMDPILSDLAAEVAAVERRRPEVPFISNVTGTWITDDEATAPEYWAMQLRRTVRFRAGLETLLRNERLLFLEAGPGRTLTSLVRRMWSRGEPAAWSSLPHPEDETMSDLEALLRTLGGLWAAGAEPDWDAFWQGERRHRRSLPTYPFERRRYWVEAAPRPEARAARTRSRRNGGQAETALVLGDDRTKGRAPEPAGSAGKAEDGMGPDAPALTRLREIFGRLLGREPSALNADRTFLELGADSLLLMHSARALEDEFGIEVGIRVLLQGAPTLNRLARYLDERRGSMGSQGGADAGEAIRDEPAESGHDVPLTPIQRWFFEQDLPNPDHFNLTTLVEVSEPLDPRALGLAVRRLIEEHDALRMRFQRSASGWIQRVEPFDGATPFQWEDLGKTAPEALEAAIESLSARAQESLDLADGPLIRVVYFSLGAERTDRLLLVVHHLVADAISLRILLDDLWRRSTAVRKGVSLESRSKRASFARWAKALAEYADSDEIRAESAYWLDATRGDVVRLPRDRRGSNDLGTERGISVELAEETTRRLLHDVARAFEARVDEVLIAVLAEGLAGWAGGRTLAIALEGHGRDEGVAGPDVVTTVGWFTALFPLMLRLEGTDGVVGVLRRVQESFRAVPRGGIGYGILRYLGRDEGTRQRLASTAEAEVSFTYFGQAGSQSVGAFRPARESPGPWHASAGRRQHLLDIEAVVTAGRLRVHWTYSGAVHEAETVRTLANRCLELLTELVEGQTTHDAVATEPRARTGQAGTPAASCEGEAAPPAPTGSDADRGPEPVPLSSPQRQLWFIEQAAPGSTVAYHVPVCKLLIGELDVEAFRRSLNEVVRRHESLRTTFRRFGGDPMQVVLPSLEIPCPVHRLDRVPESRAMEEVHRLARAELYRPFDLENGPLLRCRLWRLAPHRHVCLLVMHHIVTDGLSVAIFERELFRSYADLRAGRTPSFARAPIPYRRFVEWQREWREGPEFEEHLRYWTGKLAGADFDLELPTGRARPRLQSYEGAVYGLEFPTDTVDRMTELSAREGATRFMFLLAVFKTLLYRYTGNTDICVGSPIANRNMKGSEEVIGFFANLLVLRTDLGGDPTFREVLHRVRDTAVDAFAYQDMPFEELVNRLSPDRSSSRTPLVQIAFAFHNVSDDTEAETGGLRLRPVPIEQGLGFDLLLQVYQGRTRLWGAIEYVTELFDRAAIGRIADRFATILRRVVDDPDVSIGELPLLGEGERDRLLEFAHGPAGGGGGVECVHERVGRVAVEEPARVAVECGAAVLTYGELEERANKLARHLAALGVGLEDRVGLLLERNVELAVGMLGILKAGGCYVPLDPAHPVERLSYILRDAGVERVVTQTSLWEGVSAALAEVVGGEERVICLDREWGRIGRRSGRSAPASGVGPENLAYIIYTSGSTGKPKGSLICHRSVAGYMDGYLEAGGEGAGPETWLQYSALSWDALTLELLTPLLRGARCAIYPLGAEGGVSAEGLGRCVERHGVTTLWMTASFFNTVVETAPEVLARLRLLIVGGEPLSVTHVRRAVEELPSVRLVNGYGPSECTVFSSCHEITPADLEGTAIPIGRPVGDRRCYVLDRRLQPVPVGVTGELYVGGAAVARGYLKRPGLTAERFVPDPFAPEAGARLYRTGDRARWREDGRLEFVGRLDEQVKIRGYRIEPGEIERVLAAHEEVRRAVVLARGEGAERRLVAYVVGDGDGERAGLASRLREHLQRELPDYMVPAAIVALDTLPLTPTGKLDRHALPAPDLRTAEQPAVVPPRDPVESELLKLWEKVLGRGGFGVTDDFFQVGGDSLGAFKLLAAIQDRLGCELPFPALLQERTVARQALLLQSRPDAIDVPPLVELRPSGTWPPLFLVHPGDGMLLGYRDLVAHVDEEQPIYGLQDPTLTHRSGPRLGVRELASIYVNAIRSAGIEGPYRLAGWSFGGYVAFEMAHLLTERGDRVDGVFLLDTWAPSTIERTPELFDEVNLPVALARETATVAGKELSVSADEVRGMAEDKRLPYLLRELKALGLVPADAGVDVFSRFLDHWHRRMHAVTANDYRPFPGRLILFRARDTDAPDAIWDRILELAEADETVGWQGYSMQPVEVHVVPGTHGSLASEPHVRTFAALLNSRLRPRGRVPVSLMASTEVR